MTTDADREPWTKHWSAGHGSGAANLQAWIDAGRPAADLGQLCITGPLRAVRAVREVIAVLPAAVQWHVVRTTRFTCAARDYNVTAPSPAPPVDERTHITLTSWDRDVVCHEVAHAWGRASDLKMTAFEIEALNGDSLALSGDLRVAVDDHFDQMERAADELAGLWLNAPVDTRRRDGRRYTMRDLEDVP